MSRPNSRWILVMLACFTFVSYLLRSNISVGAEQMMPALDLSKIDMGKIFSSFLIGYAIFQIPGGLLGDRIGPKLTLGISVIVWGICTVFTGLVNRAAPGSWMSPFASLWLIRFVLGLAEATTYPVAARVVYNWIGIENRAWATSLMLTGTSFGAAAASPLMSWLMVRVGWHHSFWITAIPAFLLGLAWFVFARDTPTGRQVRIEQPSMSASLSAVGGQKSLWEILSSRRVVLLCVSYISEGYVLFLFVFWLFNYLVEVRGFSILEGGAITALPWITGFCFTPLGGFFADRIAATRGRLAGFKYVVMVGYSASGLLLFVGAYASHPVVCIAALCLSVGFLMAAETPFWACATYLSGRHAGTVSGVMNTVGIVGGIFSTRLIPVLEARFGALVALSSGAVMAIACSLMWIAIGSESRSTRLDGSKVLSQTRG